MKMSCLSEKPAQPLRLDLLRVRAPSHLCQVFLAAENSFRFCPCSGKTTSQVFRDLKQLSSVDLATCEACFCYHKQVVVSSKSRTNLG